MSKSSNQQIRHRRHFQSGVWYFCVASTTKIPRYLARYGCQTNLSQQSFIFHEFLQNEIPLRCYDLLSTHHAQQFAYRRFFELSDYSHAAPFKMYWVDFHAIKSRPAFKMHSIGFRASKSSCINILVRIGPTFFETFTGTEFVVVDNDMKLTILGSPLLTCLASSYLFTVVSRLLFHEKHIRSHINSLLKVFH